MVDVEQVVVDVEEVVVVVEGNVADVVHDGISEEDDDVDVMFKQLSNTKHSFYRALVFNQPPLICNLFL